jgi:hypothetical protein
VQDPAKSLVVDRSRRPDSNRGPLHYELSASTLRIPRFPCKCGSGARTLSPWKSTEVHSAPAMCSNGVPMGAEECVDATARSGLSRQGAETGLRSGFRSRRFNCCSFPSSSEWRAPPALSLSRESGSEVSERRRYCLSSKPGAQPGGEPGARIVHLSGGRDRARFGAPYAGPASASGSVSAALPGPARR